MARKHSNISVTGERVVTIKLPLRVAHLVSAALADAEETDVRELQQLLRQHITHGVET